MNQLTLEMRQPEPENIPVERTPVKEGKKLSRISNKSYTAKDLVGLTWVLFEEDF
jgi:hypothetical protein